VRIALTRDAEEFTRLAGGMLEQRIERNLLATVLSNILQGGYSDAEPLFARGIDDDGQTRFAAMRTPPWPMLATELEPEAAPDLIAAWLEVDPELPGVGGVPTASWAIAEAWSATTGGHTTCHMREAMHVLEDVRDPPRPASGRLRLAQPADRGLLIEWMQDFTVEAGLAGVELAPRMIDGRMARESLLVWDHLGPVSMVGITQPVARVVRIGPVYTPLQYRRNGYAGSAVAAVSRRALARGASRCMLFTDLSNPTSNKIYAEVGYRRIADWEEYAFELG
jgi:predicted GNAT family acetyltransferase